MRVSLFGGPCAGKSTTALGIAHFLKESGVSIELVSEYVKSWACQKREVKPFDQIYLLGKQTQYEYKFLSSGIKNIVTDSPVLLSCSYTKLYNSHLGIHEPMIDIVKAYEKAYPSLNIYIERGDKPYNPEGRYQTEDEAKELDRLILEDLKSTGLPYKTFSYYDKQGIFDYVLQNIDR